MRAGIVAVNFILVMLFFSNAAGAAPHSAVVCETLLGVAFQIPASQTPTEHIHLLLGDQISPAPKRWAEVLADFENPLQTDRNLVFEMDLKENGEGYLSQVFLGLDSHQSSALRMINFQHITAMSMPFWPIVHWGKRLLGLPLERKARAFNEGWAALGTVAIGVGVVLTQNPFLNADRYIRLAIESDREIKNELSLLNSSILNGDQTIHHIFRDHEFSQYHWQAAQLANGGHVERLDLGGWQQMESDTRPAFQKLLRLLLSSVFGESKERENLLVKLDLIANPKGNKMALVVRTRIVAEQ